MKKCIWRVIDTFDAVSARLIKAYEESHRLYESMLADGKVPFWDFVIITASCAAQAAAYTAQIEQRQKENRLPVSHYFVLPDTNSDFGSGNATLHALRLIRRHASVSSFGKINSLIINSGGSSKRAPQYSVSGKLFAPVPKGTEHGGAETLFDELLAATSYVARNMRGITLVMASDILFVTGLSSFRYEKNTAMPVAVRCDAQTGTRHGVFLKGGGSYAAEFLHKLPLEILYEKGAVDGNGQVLIDTGAVVLDGSVCDTLHSLSTDSTVSEILNGVAVDFYSDFLYPMAEKSDFESYLGEAHESGASEGLAKCRRVLFDALRPYRMLINEPDCSAFYHLGTTAEVRSFFSDIPPFPEWSRKVCTNAACGQFTAINSYISTCAVIGAGTVIEDCIIGENVRIGSGCVVSALSLNESVVEENTVLHGLKLRGGSLVVQKFGIDENTKDDAVWNKKRFPTDGPDSGLRQLSFADCLENADARYPSAQRNLCVSTVKAHEYIKAVESDSALTGFSANLLMENDETFLNIVQSQAEHLTSFKKARLYLGFADRYRHMPELREDYTSKAFSCVAQDFKNIGIGEKTFYPDGDVCVSLPARVNFSGEWSDTVPYCTERGGKVLNAAVLIGGKKSVSAEIRRSDERVIRLTDCDKNKTAVLRCWSDFEDSRLPSDTFRLHKACLKVCGLTEKNIGMPLETFLSSVGGFSVETGASGLPNGSGLGISSILCCAVFKALCEYFGREISDNELYNAVLAAEQLMGSGGGWQDTVGGYKSGFKLTTCLPGVPAEISSEQLDLTPEFISELDSRFCLIYSGPRMKNRSVLREIMGSFILSPEKYGELIRRKSERSDALCNALLRKDADHFGNLLNEQLCFCAGLSPSLITKEIAEIFKMVDSLVCGKMLCGAGGGGFVQVVLREGVSKEMLSKILRQSGFPPYVKLYNSRFYVGS